MAGWLRAQRGAINGGVSGDREPQWRRLLLGNFAVFVGYFACEQLGSVAQPQGPKGDTGPAGPQGPAGPSGLAGLYWVTNSEVVPITDTANISANCRSGDQVYGGGAWFDATLVPWW